MSKFKPYILLNIILVLYSLAGICSKTASGTPFLSFGFIFFYGLSLFILGVYAVLWQQIIKKIPLNVAYSNKAITLIWGMLWGAIIFKERIYTTSIVGAAIVFIGILFMVTGGDKKIE